MSSAFAYLFTALQLRAIALSRFVVNKLWGAVAQPARVSDIQGGVDRYGFSLLICIIQ